MSDDVRVFRLDQAAQKLIGRVRSTAGAAGTAVPGSNQWLHAVLYMFGPDVEGMVEGLSASDLRRGVEAKLKAGDLGTPIEERTVLEAADALSRGRKDAGARSEDIAAAVLAICGYRLKGAVRINPRTIQEDPNAGKFEGQAESGSGNGGQSILEQFGRDLTREARSGFLIELMGREEEISTLIEVLCRTTKRNPVLVGPPGVGKTAIAEGLAVRVAAGSVPSLLKGHRVVAVHPSTLAAGIRTQGDLQERVRKLIEEAVAGKVILFMDEVHSLVGMGGDAGSNDLATLFKPALARGEIAVVAATTDGEFRRFIETDGALERRFQPIRVQALGPVATLELLRNRKSQLAGSRGVSVDDDVLAWIIDFTDRHMRSRYFPDKAIDLLEQCVAHAAANSHKVVDLAEARGVAERMIGMPLEVDERIGAQRSVLVERGLLSDRDTSLLVGHLHVRMRGFAVNPERPNAALLLLDEAASSADLLCETVAEALYGSEDRVMTFDMGRISDAQSITLLVGSPPSYIGYDEPVPIHHLLQAPWSVVRLENMQSSHPRARALVEQALVSGYFTDGSGQRVYLSDAVVVMTATGCPATDNGVAPETTYADEPDAPARRCAEMLLGAGLVSMCDIVATALPSGGSEMMDWVADDVLADLAERFKQQGLDIVWDETLLVWLDEKRRAAQRRRDWERLVDTRLTPALVSAIPPRGQRVSVRVACRDAGIVIELAGGA